MAHPRMILIQWVFGEIGMVLGTRIGSGGKNPKVERMSSLFLFRK
jgi:hypothetical protein